MFKLKYFEGAKPNNVLKETTYVRRRKEFEKSIQNEETHSIGSGRCLICCSGHVIKVLSIATGECIHQLKGHSNQINSIIINPDNRFQLYSASSDKTIIKWDYQDGVQLKVFQTKYPLVALYKRPGNSDLLATNSGSHKGHDLVSFSLKHVKDTKLKGSVIISRIYAKENAVSVGCNGDYVAAINESHLTVYSFETGKTKQCYLDHLDKVKTKFTCVACHPVDACVATGLSNGKIILWNNIFAKKKIVKTPIHWHSLPVIDLTFTAEGSYLLSGGHECVLVKWQHKSHHKDTLPRLGSPVIGITCSNDGTLYATCHGDNSIQVIANNFKITQHCQGLTGGYLDQQLKQPIPVGLQLDPRTKALVTNGRPGHLQFYSLQRDVQLYNLDIVCQNYISPENLQRPLTVTELENVAFDKMGDWLATVERWEDRESSLEMKLKFWMYNVETQRFLLNTCVDLPHSSKVNTLKFRPLSSLNDNDQLMAVTTSNDGKFKLWSLIDDSDIYRKNVCWNCESVGFYRDLPAGPANFSEDGSLLAVGFGCKFTLWDPNDNALKHTYSLDHEISHIEFSSGSFVGSVMIATKTELVCWNMLSCTVSWIVPLDIAVLVKSPNTDHIAVFTRTKELYVFTPKMRQYVFHRKRISESDVIAAFFEPYQEQDYEEEDTNLLWHARCQLYFMNQKQELLTLTNGDKKDNQEKLNVKFTENLPETPFSKLLSMKKQQEFESKTQYKQSSVISQQSSTFIKEMLSTPAHVQPPMTSLCKGFIESLLPQNHSNFDNNKEEDSNQEDIDNSDSDMDISNYTAESEKTSDKSALTVTSDLKELSLEEQRTKDFKNIKTKKFRWMETLF